MDQEQKTTQIRLGSSFTLIHLNQNRSIQLYSGFIIGRSDGNEKFPADSLMSGKHAKFHVVGQEVYIEDLGSTNQTKVNGKTIVPNQRVKLSFGDEVTMGNQAFRLMGSGSREGISYLKQFFRFKTWRTPSISLGIVLSLFTLILSKPTSVSCLNNGILYSETSFSLIGVIVKLLSLFYILYLHYRHSFKIPEGFSSNLFPWIGACFSYFMMIVLLEVIVGPRGLDRRYEAVELACECFGITPAPRSLNYCTGWYETGRARNGIKFSDLDPKLQDDFKATMKQRFPDSELIPILSKAIKLQELKQYEAALQTLKEIHTLRPEGFQGSKDIEKSVKEALQTQGPGSSPAGR